MADTVAERVAAGVAWLDQQDPGWWRTDAQGRGDANESWESGPINLEELSMHHPCYCVLGQRWGTFYSAPLTLGDAVARGFHCQLGDYDPNARPEEVEYDALTAEWARVIEERRAAVGAVV